MLALGLAVGDVDEAASDADGRMLVLAGAGAGAVQHRLPLVLVEEEGVGAQHGEDALPRSDAAAHFLQRAKKQMRKHLNFFFFLKIFQNS